MRNSCHLLRVRVSAVAECACAATADIACWCQSRQVGGCLDPSSCRVSVSSRFTLAMFRSPSANFDRLLEKATSQLLLEPDWSSVLLLCDLVRSGDVSAKYALNSLRKRMYNDNPHVSLFALQTLESCVKNCGNPFHDEVASREFMEELRQMLRQNSDQRIKAKILEIIQNWGNVFEKSGKYAIFNETWRLMRAEGWEFPPLLETTAMFDADVAPEWQEGEVCHHCRIQFGLVTRQHHCRACGQVFCARCSSKTCLLPKFGIEKEVRVCDACFDIHAPKEDLSDTETPSVKRKGKRAKKTDEDDDDEEPLPPEYLASPLSKQLKSILECQQGLKSALPQSQMPSSSGKSEEEIKEEEELQLALALSKSEAEERESKRKSVNTSVVKEQQQPSKKESTGNDEEGLSPELMRYLNRDYWEDRERQRSKDESEMKTTATTESVEKSKTSPDESSGNTSSVMPSSTAKSAEELDEFVSTLRTQVEIFVNRMKSNSSRGRSIANDSSVQTLFMNTMAMHSQLLRNIQEQEDKRVHYEGLQDKLTQVRDARAALDALREEERERKRREAEEAERLRQVQMREKLEVMRQKKQEYLQYQRQLALQRMQEQEREMLMRQQQVKQQQYFAPQPQANPMGMYGYPPMVYQPQQPHYAQDGPMQTHYQGTIMGQQQVNPQVGAQPQLPPQQQPQQPMAPPPMAPPQQQQQLPSQQHQQLPPQLASLPPQHQPQVAPQGIPPPSSMPYNNVSSDNNNSALNNFTAPMSAALPAAPNAPLETPQPQVQEAQLISFD